MKLFIFLYFNKPLNFILISYKHFKSLFNQFVLSIINLLCIIIKFVVMPLMLMLFIAAFYPVDCASLDNQQSPQQQFQNMLDSLPPIQLQQFNEEFGIDQANMRPRIFLAVIINVAIVGAVVYGPAIVNGLFNGITELPSTLSIIAHNFSTFLFESAQQAALRQYNSADPDTAARMLQRIIELSRNNGQLPPPA